MFLPRFRMSFWQWQNCLNRLALIKEGKTKGGSIAALSPRLTGGFMNIWPGCLKQGIHNENTE